MLPSRHLTILIFLVLLITGMDRCVHSAVDARAVQKAIDRGVTFLRKQQQDEGGWDEFRNHNCGLSALCTLALMNCGYDHTDATVAQALEYLRGFEPRDTYSVSLQTMVFCQARQAKDLPIIRTNVQWLREAQLPPEAPRAGSWTYGKSRSAGDPSNTQFALLALHAAEERGIPVSPEIFARAEEYWLQRQSRNGGWTYAQSGPGQRMPPSGSMTCAGIASLVIARSHSNSGQARFEEGNIVCCGEEVQQRDAIGDALAWLNENLLVRNNPGTGNNTLYYLYALERVGRLTGKRLIGGRDWYREGAEYLVEIQDDFDGSWKGASPGEQRPTIATSFALLFLSKGKRRVVISRLEHGIGEDWNRHTNALSQLTRHVERRWEQDLTWQTVQQEGASVRDLLNAPVLFISGTGPFVTTAKQRETLKQYVEQGGFIFAQASNATGCGGGQAFESSFKQFVEETFASPLEKIRADHPIWFAEHPIAPSSLPPNFWLYGVEACCRTSIVYSPVSLACLWELSDPTGRRPLPKKWSPVIDAAAKMGQNVISYATGRQLNEKLDQRTVIQPQQAVAKTDRGFISIARLNLGAGGEQAPRALPNLMEWMRQQVAARITSQNLVVGFDEKTLQDYGIIFLHGRYDFTLTGPQRQLLAKYLRDGGTIIANSICGSEAFTEAFRREIQLVLADSPLTPLPPTHPIFTAKFRGYNLTRLTLRRPSETPEGIVVAQKVGAPLIETIRLEDRNCVFFSPYDMSCALENQGGIQCDGYQTVDAAKLGINLILYALTQ